MEVRDKKIAVLMGGVSNERDVSLRSGEAVVAALRMEGLEAAGIDVRTDDFAEIQSRLLEEKADIVFIALHGRLGEDGKIQSMLESIPLPYTGSGVAASAVCFNKLLANKVLESFDVPVPRYSFMHGSANNGSKAPPFGFPMVVKPASGGSAIGVTIARDGERLKSAMQTAFAEDKNIIIDEFIKGRELTVSVIGNGDLKILPLTEITTDEEFYNYKAKYVPGKSAHIVPARLLDEERQAVESCAEKTYRVLGCRGFARIDIILSEDGVPYVLDVNTVPGLTSTSLFPESALAAGISPGKLFMDLLGMADQ